MAVATIPLQLTVETTQTIMGSSNNKRLPMRELSQRRISTLHPSTLELLSPSDKRIRKVFKAIRLKTKCYRL